MRSLADPTTTTAQLPPLLRHRPRVIYPRASRMNGVSPGLAVRTASFSRRMVGALRAWLAVGVTPPLPLMRRRHLRPMYRWHQLSFRQRCRPLFQSFRRWLRPLLQFLFPHPPVPVCSLGGGRCAVRPRPMVSFVPLLWAILVCTVLRRAVRRGAPRLGVLDCTRPLVHGFGPTHFSSLGVNRSHMSSSCRFVLIHIALQKRTRMILIAWRRSLCICVV